MRAPAHIPLLAMERPERVLVIGFGVGNTAHAAMLHSSVRQVDVADLSRQILGHAGYFGEANRDVLRDPKVTVFVNDGRQHLQMTATGTYDLITLEPPPVAHAGVAALYSREFYERARSRLTARLMGVPSELFDVTGIAAWCPRCGDGRAGQTTRDLADLLVSRHYVDAEARLREALDLMPDSAEAHY